MKYDKEIIIERVACPLHILQLKKALKQIEQQEILRVIPGQPAVVNEVLAACKAFGHEVEVKTENNRQTLFIEKS